jgi:hypothetical protein
MDQEKLQSIRDAYPMGLTKRTVLVCAFNAAQRGMVTLVERFRASNVELPKEGKGLGLIHRQLVEAHLTAAMNVVSCVVADVPISDDISHITQNEINALMEEASRQRGRDVIKVNVDA